MRSRKAAQIVRTKYGKDYDDIVLACCDAWNEFVDTPNRVKNLCSRSWTDL